MSSLKEMQEPLKQACETIENLDTTVNDLIREHELDEDALQFELRQRIDYVAGKPVRWHHKTYQCEARIERAQWEFLCDVCSSLGTMLDN